MLERLRAARLLWPLVMTLAALAILLSLGRWQLQRLEWKEGLIHAIEERTHAEPVPLAEALKRWQAGEDVEYLRVRAEGRFDHGKELYLYAPSPDQGPGYHVFTPLVVFETGPGEGRAPQLALATLLVNRGFVPEALRDPATRAAGQINDAPIAMPVETYHQGSVKGVSVFGLLRKPEQRGAFTPDNDPKANLWFWRDLDGMLQAVRGACAEPGSGTPYCGGRTYPFFLDLEKADVPGGWPRGGVTHLELPNRHLEYALTWFGLAATLAAVFGVFAVQRLKGSGA